MPSYEDMTDDELVILTRSNDLLAFDTLHTRHRPWVKARCMKWLKNDADAEDATNETFIKAYFGIMKRKYNPPGNFKAWLGTIANHVCLDVFRRRKDDVPLDILANILPAPNDDPAHYSTVLDCISTAFASLSPDDQLLLQLKYEQEMSDAEIAETMGWSVRNTQSYLFRARGRLRRAIEATCPDEIERLKKGRVQRGRPPGNRPEDATPDVPAPEESVHENETDPAGKDKPAGSDHDVSTTKESDSESKTDPAGDDIVRGGK